jgi:hypothetical protein
MQELREKLTVLKWKPQPSALNPQPSTLDFEVSTLNPKFHSLQGGEGEGANAGAARKADSPQVETR